VKGHDRSVLECNYFVKSHVTFTSSSNLLCQRGLESVKHSKRVQYIFYGIWLLLEFFRKG